MQAENWEDFRREMMLTCEAYDRKHTKELDDAYWSALAKMQLRDFRRSSQFARERAGQEGFDRLPKPGKFWALLDDLRRAERPRNQPMQTHRMSRDEHLAHLYRAAILVAKRESMPVFKGSISRNVPELYQKEFDAKWREWDETLGLASDDHWIPRAKDLMAQWGESSPGEVNFGDALKRLA